MVKNYQILIVLIVGWMVLVAALIGDIVWPCGIEWFPRAGAFLCMFSIFSEFHLQQIDTSAIREDWRQRAAEEKYFDDPLPKVDDFYTGLKLFTHISMAAGTFVWAIGDLLIPCIKI